MERKIIFEDKNSDSLEILSLLIKFLLLIFLFSLIFLLNWYGKEKNFFALKHFYISGIKISNPENVNKILNEYLNKNLMSIDNYEIAGKICKINWYKNAKVIKKFPSEISVVVEERKPFVVALVNGKPLIFDRYGYMLDSYSKKYRYLIDDKPLLKGINDIEDIRENEKKISIYAKYISLLKRIKTNEFISNISSILVEDDGSIDLLEGFYTVLLGKDNLIPKTMAFIKWYEARDKNISSQDPTQVIVDTEDFSKGKLYIKMSYNRREAKNDY